MGAPKGIHLSIKQNKTNKSRKHEEHHPHFLGSTNPTRKTLVSHLLEILKVFSWMCQEVSKVPANNTTPFLQLKTKQRKKKRNDEQYNFFQNNFKNLHFSLREGRHLQLNLRDSPSSYVGESGVQCTATVWAGHLSRAKLPTGQRGAWVSLPHTVRRTVGSTTSHAIRKGSSGES